MPLQNRVDPWGTLFRTPARGAMMGNRGPCMHDANREIVRPFRGERWIACVLEFRGRHREVMHPGYYTELFFLDEAVSLSAGHRPCAECRRERFNAFKSAWPGATAALRAPEMDAALHRARIDDQWRKVTYRAPLRSLPDGCFVQIEESALLLWSGALHLWSPQGYGKNRRLPSGLVTVLTPRPTVEVLRNGYRPEVAEC